MMTTAPAEEAKNYESARATEMAEVAKTTKITSRPVTKTSEGRNRFCVYCGNLATLDVLFHHRVLLRDGEWNSWIVVEKHCDQCIEKYYPKAVATP